MKPNKMNNIFYSVVGAHGRENVDTILSRKQEEVSNAGYSLWAAKIDKKSIEQVWNLKPTDKVYVVCSINPNAKDPGKGSGNNVAKYYESPDGTFEIDKDVVSTFSSKRNNYQAYFVKNYKILSESERMNIGPYKCIQADGTVKTYKERFSFSRFQNTYGKLDESCTDEYYKDIDLIMELEYPFVVQLKIK